MTAPALPLLHPTLRLADETFDPVNRMRYGLYLTVRPDGGVRIGVADAPRDKFLALEDYDAAPEEDGVAPDATTTLRAIAAHHPWLRLRGWHHVRVAVAHDRFTLLPASLYRPQDAAAVLALHCDVDAAHERVQVYQHSAADMASIFVVENTLADWLHAAYGAQAVALRHHTSALVEGALHQPEASAAPAAVSLHVSGGLVTITVVRQKRLVFCNVFRFTTAEDLIYYTILVLQETELNPEQVPVTVWGDLPPDSPLFAALRRYVRVVRLGQRPLDLHYSYRLDGPLAYRYYEVFALHLCE